MAEVTAAETEPVAADWKQIGEQIMMCVSARDFDRLADRFHPQVICRVLIPAGLVTPLDVPSLMSKFGQWFGEADDFNIESSQITQVGDRLHVGYRIRLRDGGLWYLVEQQTYSQLEGDSITRFDLLCSGFRLDNAAG
jgi:hypothetical protein